MRNLLWKQRSLRNSKILLRPQRLYKYFFCAIAELAQGLGHFKSRSVEENTAIIMQKFGCFKTDEQTNKNQKQKKQNRKPKDYESLQKNWNETQKVFLILCCTYHYNRIIIDTGSGMVFVFDTHTWSQSCVHLFELIDLLYVSFHMEKSIFLLQPLTERLCPRPTLSSSTANKNSNMTQANNSLWNKTSNKPKWKYRGGNVWRGTIFTKFCGTISGTSASVSQAVAVQQPQR